MFETLRRQKKEEAKRQVLDHLAERELKKFDANVANARAAAAKEIEGAIREYAEVKAALNETRAKMEARHEKAIAALENAHADLNSANGALLSAKNKCDVIVSRAKTKLRETADPAIDLLIDEIGEAYRDLTTRSVEPDFVYTDKIDARTGNRVKQHVPVKRHQEKALALIEARRVALELKAKHCDDLSAELSRIREQAGIDK